MMNKKIAKILLDIGCVKINLERPFTYASGLQGPFYCDNRLSISFPEERKVIAKALSLLIVEKCPGDCVIGGIATAGIPHAAFVAEILKRPMVYVRSEAKSHGTQSVIEGVLEKGQRLVLVEDLINQGGSSLKVFQKLIDEGHKVDTIISIVDYETEAAQKAFEASGAKRFSLTTLTDILDVAVEESIINQDQLKELKRWRKDPKNWTKA